MDPRRAKKVKSRVNTAIYTDVIKEGGETVMLVILDWLYDGKKPPEQHLIDLYDSSDKRKQLFQGEKDKLQALREGKLQLEDMGLTFIYKLIQGSCSLKNAGREDIEQKLFKLKNDRNEICHDLSDELRNISDNNLEYLVEKAKACMYDAINEAGILSGKSAPEVQAEQLYVEGRIEDIHTGFGRQYLNVSKDNVPLANDEAGDVAYLMGDMTLPEVKKDANSTNSDVDLEDINLGISILDD